MCTLSKNEGKNPLYKSENLIVRKVDDFHLALNPDVPNIMVMDETGKRFFELCDGKRAADDVIEKILKERGSETSKEELLAFIAYMLDTNFLFLRPPQPPQKIECTQEKLTQLYLHVTKACNLRCRHCYVEAGKPVQYELTSAEALEVIEDFAKLGGERLVISGGEPFLRRELLYEIFTKSRELGIQKVFVETNGTLISDEDVEFCKKYDIELGVSLDGAVRETHEYIRGAGNYDKTINRLKKLLSAGVWVRICIVLMRPNINETEKMAYLAKDLGVKAISFTVVRETGRAEINKDLLLSVEEMHSAIVNLWLKCKEVGVETQLEEQFRNLGKLTRADLCGVGTNLLLVSSNGDVYPCNMLLEFEKFKAGNIREQRLGDIWKNSETLKVFRNLSVLDIEGCKDCELKYICGVCTAEIYKEHGNFSKKSRFCPLHKGLCWILIDELARKMWKN